MDQETVVFRYVEGRGLLTKYPHLKAHEILEREGLEAVPSDHGWTVQPIVQIPFGEALRQRDKASALF